MKQPWIIAVLSTDYDLKNERLAIIRFLKSKGIVVSAFEEAEFPILQNAHSHDNCLQALNRADLAILIVNKRYGGKYYLNDKISITEEEYNSLLIPVIVFVNKQVWDEREIYKNQQKETAEPVHFTPTFAEDIKVFDFLNNIQNSFNEHGKSNWIHFWHNLDDLKNKVPFALEGQSINIIKKIQSEQIKEVKARRTSTALSLSLGDVVDAGYYVEPEVEFQSGILTKAGLVSTIIIDKLKEHESCLLLGEAGAGKTTLMAKSYLSMVLNEGDNAFKIPVYVWLKGKGTDYSFSIFDYFEECCEKYLRKEHYPFLKIEGMDFQFFLDGFDELAEKIDRDELIKLYSTEMFQFPVLLSSRVQYAERFLNSNIFASKFSCRIKIKDWSEETAKDYIDRFCNLQKKGYKFKERIYGLLADNPDMKDLLKNPLLVTILLYVIEKSRMQIPETVTSRVALFKKCLHILADREIESKLCGSKTSIDPDKLILRWSYLAWFVYENRLCGGSFLRNSEANEKINSVNVSELKSALPNNINDVIYDTYDGYIYGALHEQFLEFLVANALAFACLNKKPPYPLFLQYVMRPEINRYFKSLIQQIDATGKQKIFNHINDLFWQCAGSTVQTDIAMRVHAVYHLSRLVNEVNDSNRPLLERIFNTEKECVVLLSLYFGVIKCGDLIREQELYDLLINNIEYSDANRGYHLAYYDSLPKQKALPYSDIADCPWSGTLKAFLRHFKSTAIEHYYLRRIDLVTMYQLMEHRRSTGPLTKDILAEFEIEVNRPLVNDLVEYQEKIVCEFVRVREKYNRLSQL